MIKISDTNPLKKYDPRFGRGLFELKKGNTSGVTSDEVKKFMDKKYKLDVGEGHYDAEGNLNSFFIRKKDLDNYGRSLSKKIYKRPKGFFGKLFSPPEKSKDSMRSLLYGLQAGTPAGKHGKIVMDQELREKAPEVTAHELGHAVNYGVSPARHFWAIGRHPITQIVGGLGGPLLSYHGIKKNNKAMAYGGAALSALPGIATLSDEAMASIRGSKSMKEMGGKPKKTRLVKAFATYANAYAPALIEAGIIGHMAHKHFNPKNSSFGGGEIKKADAPPYYGSIYDSKEYKKVRNESLKTGKINSKLVSNVIKDRAKFSLSKIEPKYKDIMNRLKFGKKENKTEFNKRRGVNTLGGYMGGMAISSLPAFYLAKKGKIEDPNSAIQIGGLVGGLGGFLATTIQGRKLLEHPTIMEKDIKIYKGLSNPKDSTHKKYLQDTLKWEFKDPIKRHVYQTGKLPKKKK